jgi:hypothetical protein
MVLTRASSQALEDTTDSSVHASPERTPYVFSSAKNDVVETNEEDDEEEEWVPQATPERSGDNSDQDKDDGQSSGQST